MSGNTRDNKEFINKRKVKNTIPYKKLYTMDDIKVHFENSDRPLYMETTAHDNWLVKARIMFMDGNCLWCFYDSKYGFYCEWSKSCFNEESGVSLDKIDQYNLRDGITFLMSL